MSNKVKGKRLDPNFVSSQPYEISYIAKKFGITPEQVRQAKRMVGKSRHRIYSYIRNNY